MTPPLNKFHNVDRIFPWFPRFLGQVLLGRRLKRLLRSYVTLRLIPIQNHSQRTVQPLEHMRCNPTQCLYSPLRVCCNPVNCLQTIEIILYFPSALLGIKFAQIAWCILSAACTTTSTCQLPASVNLVCLKRKRIRLWPPPFGPSKAGQKHGHSSEKGTAAS